MNREQIFIFISAGVLLFLLFSVFNQWNRKAFPDDMSRRAAGYIQTLSQIPFNDLNAEQRLLLLHSYYIVQDFDKVVEISKAMERQLQELPKERFQAFDMIIKDAYRKSGRGAEAPAAF